MGGGKGGESRDTLLVDLGRGVRSLVTGYATCMVTGHHSVLPF